MLVKKRDKTLSEFNSIRILDAITGAMNDTIGGIDIDVAHRVTDEIVKDIKESDENEIDVEKIQDIVENKLMDFGEHETAKAYILYRDRRSRERKDEKYGLLSKKFLKQYKNKKSPFTELGEFVYYRTYSRWLPEKHRREEWWETVRRAVEYNCSLLPTTKEEAEKLFDDIFNLRQFPAGRVLWVGGTKITEKNNLSTMNCSGMVIDSFDKFSEMFYLLLVGSGVGFRALKEDVEKLPKIRTDVDVIHKAYFAQHPKIRKENTSVIFDDDNASVVLEIGDSKEGWKNSLYWYFKILYSHEYKHIKKIILNYDNIRIKGEPLKTFGGFSSGYESLQTMFQKIHKIIRKNIDESQKLRPINVMDISNIIAENVVVGGVRRSAELSLIDYDDSECISAKSMLYKQENGKWVQNKEIAHRQMSNNTILYRKKPTYEEWGKHFEQIINSGEPGFFNEVAAKKRNPDFMVTNPCLAYDSEILTKDGYKKIGDLVGQSVEFINKNGEISKGRAWYTGEKETYEVKLGKDKSIICTGDHKFMLIDGTACEAKDLQGKKLMAFKGFEYEVTSVKPTGKIEKVYDFSEPITHWGVVENCITHNCGEVLLGDRQNCNLTTVNVMGFVEDGVLNKQRLMQSMRLNARMGYRMTAIDLELPKWDNNLKRDRLCGVSHTGWMDMINATNMDKETEEWLLTEMKAAVLGEITMIAYENGLNKSLLATSLKPSGTLSLLPGVSAGLNYSFSKYYIRRVRVSRNDPLAQVAIDLEWEVKPADDKSLDDCEMVAIEFPMQAPEGNTIQDVSAIEQLENYKRQMDYFVEHNVSATIMVRPNEWEETKKWVYDNWDECVALTFMPLDDHFYPLAPYERITQEEYEEREKNMKSFVPSLINKYEREKYDHDVEEDASCTTGACPVR